MLHRNPENLNTYLAQTGNRLVTPSWLRARLAEVCAIQSSRERLLTANTSLLIVAAQHPLIHGRLPGYEFTERLMAAQERYQEIIENGGQAEFFLPGSRHHHHASGHTDVVALYDAAGRWLVDRGVPSVALHAQDWIEIHRPQGIYTGAAEIGVAAAGFLADDRFESAEYFCSPGQSTRARMYSLAYGLPMTIQIPDSLSENQAEQVHGQLWQRLILDGLATTIDPYGEGLLGRMTQSRIPDDGILGTPASAVPDYADLPWYS